MKKAIVKIQKTKIQGGSFMKKRRYVAGMLAVSMGMSLLSGCGGKNAVGTADNTNSDSTADSKTEGTIDFNEEPYEVVIENLTLGEDMPDLQKVEDAINEITLKEINCTVKLLNIHIGDHPTKLALMAAGGDKVDIVTTGRTYALPNMVSDGMLLPLNDLLDERGKELKEKDGDYLKANQFGDNIYAVPGLPYSFQSTGIMYNKDIADAAGIEVPEHITMADLEDIAAKLKEYDPNLTLLSKGTGSTTSDMYFTMHYPQYKTASGLAVYGMYDEADESYTLINTFKSEDYRKYLSECRKWYENKWVPQDSMVSGVNVRDTFYAGQSFCEGSQCSPLQIGLEQSSVNFNLGMAYLTDPIMDTTAIQENGWGIFINSERPDKAMDFLNLMYTNEAVANLLSNGIEGIHYEKVSDHIIKFPEGVDSTNIGYKKDFSSFGDMMQTYQFEPTTEEALDECRKRDENAEKSPLLGYVFDTTDYSTQISNVTNVLSEYLPGLTVGIYTEKEIDEQLQKMNEALDAAGLDELIAANQEQLNQWLSENK